MPLLDDETIVHKSKTIPDLVIIATKIPDYEHLYIYSIEIQREDNEYKPIPLYSCCSDYMEVIEGFKQIEQEFIEANQ